VIGGDHHGDREVAREAELDEGRDRLGGAVLLARPGLEAAALSRKVPFRPLKKVD